MKFSKLILANLFRKKARLVLTIGSFAVALFLFALLGVVSDAFSRGADVVSAESPRHHQSHFHHQHDSAVLPG